MLKFIIRRMVRAFVTLILFQSLLFALIHTLPYDFTAFTLQGPSWREFMQRQLGLDLPLWTQYFRWLGKFLQFDLGVSFQNWPAPVSAILFNRISRTLLLLPKAIEGDTIVISFKYPVHKENMEKIDNQKTAEKIIGNFLGRSCQVRCVYEPENNHLVKAALKMGAQVIDTEEK